MMSEPAGKLAGAAGVEADAGAAFEGDSLTAGADSEGPGPDAAETGAASRPKRKIATVMSDR